MPSPLVRRALIVVALLFPALSARADDWPQWRGPARNGISHEKNWLAGWPAGKEPRVAWRAKLGKGHSAATVVGERVYTMGWDGLRDTVFCLDAATGKPVWRQSYPCKTILQWPGPRATPTVADGVVYTLGQHGQLHAWAAADGKPVWAVQLPDEYNPDVDYGFAWSPLVEGDLLILGTGSKGLALRRKDGSFAWGNDGRRGACASAVPFMHNGTRGVAVLTQEPDRESSSIVGVDPKTGRELWRHGPWKEKWGSASVDLLFDDAGHVFVTSAEQFKQSARYTIEGTGLREDWKTNKFYCYTGGAVLLGDCLYGVSQTGRLTCLDWKTGEAKWAQPGFGEHASLMAADGKLIVQAGKSGELVVAEATLQKYTAQRKMQVFNEDAATTFTMPVLANGRIYCRSYAGEMVCLDLRRSD